MRCPLPALAALLCAGTLALQLSGLAAIVLYQVTAGTTVIPFAVVQVTAGVTGCTYQNLLN